jgi:DNA polymerase-3 subunit chi
MTERVDFYVLNSTAALERWTYACRLIEKAYLRDLSIVVVNGTPAEARSLDDLLWTFNDRSFIPHRICLEGESPDPAAKVHLTLEPAALPAADLLVNLASRLPAQWQRHVRIAEIIDADEECRRLGRERFKSYREFKVPLETHQEDQRDHG